MNFDSLLTLLRLGDEVALRTILQSSGESPDIGDFLQLIKSGYEIPTYLSDYFSRERVERCQVEKLARIATANKMDKEPWRDLYRLYASVGLPASIGSTAKVFDPNNINHRFHDQISFGFPFTSNRHPWPKDSENFPMQPVVQLDLSRASENLGCDLGVGLIQVWIDTTDLTNPFPLKSRHINAEDMLEELDWNYPDNEIWLRKNRPSWEFEWARFCPEVRTPLIEWNSLGKVFPVSLSSFRDEWVIENFLGASRKLSQNDMDCFREVIIKSQDIRLTQGFDREYSILGGYAFDWLEDRMRIERQQWGSSFNPEDMDLPDVFPKYFGNGRLLFYSRYSNGSGPCGVGVWLEIEGGEYIVRSEIYETSI